MTTIVKLTKEQLEAKAQFIDEYMKANNAADGSSVDANANVSNKNISTLMAELHKDFNIQIKRYLVSRKIEAMFGEELAKEYNRQIESHEIYANDESGLAPYCVSITLYPFLLNGLKDLGGESSAPKHLASFCGSFINLVFAVSSQFMGAVAVPETLIYFNYMATKDFGEDYLEKYPDLIKNCFQQIVYSINQPAAARGYQSVFFNMSIFDKPYFEAIFGDFRFPDGSAPNYKTLAKLQAFFMDWFNEERRKALLTFPVMTSAMLTDGKKPVDEEFLDMCAEQDSKGNSFFKYMSDSADSLASCCRLRNELQENTFSYSLGAGGVATGSLNVLTLNANRFIQNCVKAGKDIFEELKLQIQKMHKYQMATKEYFRDYLKANMLPVYNAGYITMEKQFLTIGINGLLEGAEFLGYKPGNNEEYKAFTSKFLKVMYDENKADRTRYNNTFWYTFNLNDTKYYWFDETPVKVFDKALNKEVIVLAKEVMYNLEKYSQDGIDFTNITINKEKYKPSLKNVEFIPGESVGVKNYKWDKKDGYIVNPKRNCYNSYLYPVEDENIDIVDKFIIHGKENLQYLDGGSALHLNLEEYPNKEGYKKLYYLAAETGCNYWTTNIKVTCCEDCGNIDKRTLKACPKCGSKNITYATRIIGYLKKVSSFSSERQKEEDMRYYHKV